MQPKGPAEPMLHNLRFRSQAAGREAVAEQPFQLSDQIGTQTGTLAEDRMTVGSGLAAKLQSIPAA